MLQSSSTTRVFAREPALWFTVLLALAWVAVPALLNPGQPGDHFEQFTWAHSLEWGYHKHPPLPTWLLAAALALLDPTPYATYAVAGGLLAGTAVFTYLFARRLLGPGLAAVSIVLWGLLWSFTWKGQMLNHNSVMICCIAAAAWLAVEAAQRPRAWGWWALLGMACGLALMSKYQAAVPLVGILLALWRGGLLASADNRRGLLLAVVICLALFAPHVMWMVQTDFQTLSYASASVAQLDAWGRVRKLVTFSVLQLRMLAMALACIGLLMLWQRRQPVLPTPVDLPTMPDHERRAWLLGLLVWPLAVLAGLCLAQGMRLQDHWGFQALQFVSVWLAWCLRGQAPQALGRLMLLALIGHVLVMGAYARSVWEPSTLAKRSRPDQFYPARELAQAVMQDWQRVSSCPLRFVVGPTYEAGMVSVYSGVNPVVFELGSPRHSPWVDPDALRESGAVYVYGAPPDALPPGAWPFLYQRGFTVPGTERSLHDVYWAVLPPRDLSCRPPAPA